MRALITGGRGFVGRHLTEELLSHGDEVEVTDVECDVSDPALMGEVVARARPDALFHLAAVSHVGESWHDPTEVLRVNVLGTAVTLAALRQHAPAARALVISSAEVYGAVTEAELPLTEASPTRPDSPYAASKLAAEVVALQAVRGFGQPVVVARSFNHLGPGQSPAFFVPGLTSRLLDAQRHGARTVAVGNLESRRDFTDVRDVVRAYRLLIERGAPGEVYNVASGTDRSIAAVAETLRAMIDPGIEFVTDPALLRPVDIPVLRGSAEKLRAATGWSPTIPFDQTLADVVADRRAAG